MEESGSVTYWNTDRGFGFVRVDGTAKDVFVHNKVLKLFGSGRVPAPGDRMRVTAINSKGKPEAVAARFIG